MYVSAAVQFVCENITTTPPPFPYPTHAWHHDVIQLYIEKQTNKIKTGIWS